METRWSNYFYRIDFLQFEHRNRIIVWCDERYKNEYLLAKMGGLLSMLLYRVALRNRGTYGYELIFESRMSDLEVL